MITPINRTAQNHLAPDARGWAGAARSRKGWDGSMPDVKIGMWE